VFGSMAYNGFGRVEKTQIPLRQQNGDLNPRGGFEDSQLTDKNSKTQTSTVRIFSDLVPALHRYDTRMRSRRRTMDRQYDCRMGKNLKGRRMESRISLGPMALRN
jgi:hypothetical protein